MGKRSYTAYCSGEGPQRRTEQMLLDDWCPGSPDTNQRYFSLAFRLVDVPVAPEPGTRGFIAQLHQGGSDPIPFRVQWEYLCPPESAACGYYVTMLVRSNGVPVEIGPEIPGSQNHRKGFAVPLNVWTRMLFRFSTPGAATGEAQVWLIDDSTGALSDAGSFPPADSPGPVGSTASSACFQWKVGIYSNDKDTIKVDYDNVTYGKRWNHITKNRLIGHQKNVLRLTFDETFGSTANDASYTLNGGQAGNEVTDYDNDGTVYDSNGTIVGSPQWGGGHLHFNASTHVRVPMDTTDFDVGNYVTVSAWFRTTEHFAGNRGLVMLDEYSMTWKMLLYVSDTNLSFGVRHPDDTYSKINHTIPAGSLADGRWHHVVGTFNRFAPRSSPADPHRIKLYIDGRPVLQATGSDLPIYVGDTEFSGSVPAYLSVGKFSVNGYFKGDIHEASVFNYAMTASQQNAHCQATRPAGAVCNSLPSP